MDHHRGIQLPFVSCVTPVYNAEDYLAECIESVLSQSYDFFEYIIVNNVSTDRSLEIARDYEKRDSRIRVFDNHKHLEQVDNINHALSKISPSSKYCKIVFADDWLYPECIERMVQLAEKHPSVGIVSSYYVWGTEVMNVGLPPVTSSYRGPALCRRMLLTGEFFFGTASVILMRSELIRARNPFYDNNSMHEDTEACYELLQNCDFGFIPQVLSYTRRGNLSVTSSISSYNPALLDYFTAMKKFGPFYLNEDEYKRRLSEVGRWYKMFLGLSFLKRKDKAFWNYHQKYLRRVNFSLTTSRLIKYSILAGLDLLCNPKRTVQRLIDRRKARQAPVSACEHSLSNF